MSKDYIGSNPIPGALVLAPWSEVTKDQKFVLKFLGTYALVWFLVTLGSFLLFGNAGLTATILVFLIPVVWLAWIVNDEDRTGRATARINSWTARLDAKAEKILAKKAAKK